MSNINKVITLSNLLDYIEILELHNRILTTKTFIAEDFIAFFEQDIADYINILNTPYQIKHTEFNEYLQKNPSIKLNYIDDWKDDTKFNSIILLISFNYLNDKTLHSIIGNQTKKTYKNGDIINDNSLALKKFFDKNYQNFRTIFYKSLNIIMKDFEKLGFELSEIENTFYSMIGIIQADVACRNKYDNGEYYDYKTRINDIIETRKKEDTLFELFHKVTFNKLVNDPKNESLKYILLNGWDATEKKYLWLTKLITFVNNNSEDAKDYLINNTGINDFTGDSNIIKCGVIEEVCKKVKLNISKVKQIIKFIFSIGQFYKHRTYNKWYKKEMEAIETFDAHKEKDLQVTLDEMLEKFKKDDNQHITSSMQLFSNYYANLSSIFS